MTNVMVDPAQAEELWEVGDGETVGPWTRVGEQVLSKTRWHEWRYLLFNDEDGAVWGIKIGVGLTEEQDHELPWKDYATGKPMRPVESVRLYPHEITRTEYRKEPPA